MIVTVDVWDTLIRRRCHPDAVKDAVSENLLLLHRNRIRPELRDISALTELRVACEAKIGAESRAQGFDDEYPIAAVFDRWLTEALLSETPDIDRPACIAALMEFEVNHEILVTYKDPHIEQELLKHGTRDIRVISDFYMPWPMLSRIIEANGLLHLISRGYVSCDLKYNKRSGRIFDQIPDLLGRKDWVHIGDNEHSDVRMPGERGATAVHFLPTGEHELREQRNKRHRNPAASIAALKKRIAEKSASGLELLGRDAALGLAGFALHIQQTAIRAGTERILFLTREGVFFQKLHTELFAETMKPISAGLLLPVSRLSTFVASLRSPNLGEVSRLWKQYHNSSPSAWFSSLGMPLDEPLRRLIEQAGLHPDTRVDSPADDTRVVSLFSHSELVEKLSLRITRAREELFRHLASLGFTSGPETVLIVDIGWRGSIQDNLALLFPEKRFVGCYLGLDRFLSAQPANSTKTGYVFHREENISDDGLLECVSPLEMLLNSPSGSVIGYRQTSSGSEAVTALGEHAARSFAASAGPFQSGAITAIRRIRRDFHAQNLTADDLRNELKSWWLTAMETPPVELSESFLSLAHDETFGHGEIIVKNPSISWLKSWAFPLVPGWSSEVRRKINAIGWSRGYETAPSACPHLKRAIRIDRWLKRI